MKKTLRRARWTSPLAWAVWNQRQRRKSSGETIQCNVYYFKPLDADRLDFDTTFTGNFKANIATFNGNTGVNSQITTVLVNSPEEARTDASLLVWNQVDLGVTDMDGICDGTFDGVIPSYAKDDVWFNVNMGAE